MTHLPVPRRGGYAPLCGPPGGANLIGSSPSGTKTGPVARAAGPVPVLVPVLTMRQAIRSSTIGVAVNSVPAGAMSYADSSASSA